MSCLFHYRPPGTPAAGAGDPIAPVDGTENIDGNLSPSITATYDLGATGLRWKDLFLSGNADVTGTITAGGQILAPAGSTSAPAVASSTDPDTGWVWEGSNVLAFSSGNSRCFTLANVSGVPTFSSVLSGGDLVLAAAQSGGQAILKGNRAAADNVPDIILRSTVARNSGKLMVNVHNNTTYVAGFNSDGALGTWGVTPPTTRQTFTITNDETDRSFDADTITPSDIANVLATFIKDIAATGLVATA